MQHRMILGLVTLTLLSAPALAGQYYAGGTFVAKTGFGTLVDNGGVICDGTNGDGIGGGCLEFPIRGLATPANRAGTFVSVHDAAADSRVAFQVCIDNNGDGICGGPLADEDPCFDQIYFSHDDEGRFFNPLGPLPTNFLEGCEHNGGFAGYVILLCQGAHEVNGASHTHTLSQGHITLSDKGTGYGDFCGGAGGNGTALDIGRNPAVAKGYVIV